MAACPIGLRPRMFPPNFVTVSVRNELNDYSAHVLLIEAHAPLCMHRFFPIGRHHPPSLVAFFTLRRPFSRRKQPLNLPFRLGQPPPLPVQGEIEPLGRVKLMGAVR